MDGVIGENLDEAILFLNSKFIDILNMDSFRPVFHTLKEPYIGAHSLEGGIERSIEFHSRGLQCTFDILGERPPDIEGSNRLYAGNLRLLDLMANKMAGSEATLSTKLTSICAVETNPDGSVKTSNGNAVFWPQTNPFQRLESIVAYAKERQINVTLDMEESALTDISLFIADYLWSNGYDNFGIVLQSRLNRTQQDILNLGKTRYSIPRENQRIREVIGIYIEPANIATRSKREAKRRLIERVRESFSAGFYVEIATHDLGVIDVIMNDVIIPMHIDPSRTEFQVLLGVKNGEIATEKLKQEGYTGRVYTPVEINAGDANPYIIRRLKENPGLVVAGAKNIVQRIF